MKLSNFKAVLQELETLAYHSKCGVEIDADANIVTVTTETGEEFQSTKYDGTLQDNMFEAIDWIMDNHFRDTYYHRELKNLDMFDHLQIQIKGQNAQTKWMSLNDESIAAVRFFLKRFRQFTHDNCGGDYGLRLERELENDKK